ncbi:MAG: hypothetical protein MR474_08465 [Megasphaera elsdenii]|nr:hypothetical protein [Megasphaera elsdenii]MCI7217696.1 hypothetical protein [Megasphaera elsdenii]MDY5214327.1 hypothetical protein [Megasphaera elsdenii]
MGGIFYYDFRAYVGAKFTHLAPKPLLKAAIVAMPTLGGIIMVLFGR